MMRAFCRCSASIDEAKSTGELSEMFALIDNTTGRSWEYESEAQLKTVTRLYAVQNPKSSLSVTIAGHTTKIR